MNKSRETRAATFKHQRDTLFWILSRNLKKNQTQISIMCKDAGFKIDRSTISEILAEKQKEIILEESIRDDVAASQAEKPPEAPESPK